MYYDLFRLKGKAEAFFLSGMENSKLRDKF